MVQDLDDDVINLKTLGAGSPDREQKEEQNQEKDQYDDVIEPT